MPYDEYAGWQEYYGVEPWGTSVVDAAQANIVYAIAEVNRDSKTRKTPHQLNEFLLFKAREEPAGPVLLDDPNAQTEALIQAMFGGDVQRA